MWGSREGRGKKTRLERERRKVGRTRRWGSRKGGEKKVGLERERRKVGGARGRAEKRR